MNVDDLLKELDDIPGVSKSKERTTGSSLAPSRSSNSVNTGASSISAVKTMSTPLGQNHPSSSAYMPKTMAQTQIRPPKNEAVSASNAFNSIDKLLDDLDLPTSPSNHVPKKSPLAHAHTAPAQRDSGATTAKCMSLFIGGAGQARGRNGSLVGQVLCCDSLRCTKCDFKVIWFENRSWKDDVDYLFFRNNYPTDSKLMPKLFMDQGRRSYCCQCSWRTASDHTVVDSFSGDLRWVCGGHVPS
jgi:hypothetical protein